VLVVLQICFLLGGSAPFVQLLHAY
jgi:hypothetical protein